MSYFDTLKDQLNQNDIFCRENSIRLTEIREGYAEAVMSIDEHKLNANNVVQGGAIFTLADFALLRPVFLFRPVPPSTSSAPARETTSPPAPKSSTAVNAPASSKPKYSTTPANS